jgi:predicted transcriptional regulator
MSSRRSRLEIMEKVVRLCFVLTPTKSEIMYRAKLSFRQLEEFLTTCEYSGLLKKQVKGSRVVYKITDKGKEFLKEYRNFTNAMKELKVAPKVYTKVSGDES